MSNLSRAILVGGTLVLLVSAGTAGAFTGTDDSRTATSAPTGTSISVRPTTTSPTPSGTSAPASTVDAAGVSAVEAGRIALAEVGGGRVARAEREREHGGWEWHVRVEGPGGRHDVRVDAATGAVTRGGDDH